MNLAKYKQNLRIENNKVISYTTHVATIDQDNLIQPGHCQNSNNSKTY